MKITLFQKDWEEGRKGVISTVHIEDAGCTLEVTESITGTQVTIKRGSARIVNEAVVEEKPSRLYHIVVENGTLKVQ